MKTLQTIFLVLLLSTFSSAYAGRCMNDKGVKGIVIHEDGVVCDPNPDSYDTPAQYVLGMWYHSFLKLHYYYQWLPVFKVAEAAKEKVLLLTSTFSSAYAGDCFKDKDVADCRMKAEQGDAGAQFNLGSMYGLGRGVPLDAKEAFKWYRLAAEQGDADAQFNLGLMYKDGNGVVRDYKEAVKWYRLAAEQGYAVAQNSLGVMYKLGRGVAQDYVMAHMYFNIAGTGRGLIEEKMTPSQIAEAQKLAREWMKKHP